MQQKYPDAALVPILQRFLAGDFHYHLYTNNLTPDDASVLGDFTEAAWGGYAAQTVVAADFSLTGVSAHVGGVTGLPVTFTNSSGGDQSAYGYYVTNTGNTQLLACARFDAAPVLKHNTESWLVIPTFGDFQDTP